MAIPPGKVIENTSVVVKIKLDGKDLADSYGIQSIKVHHAVNRISTAELILAGSNAIQTGNIAISDNDDFNPGKIVEILVGYGSREVNTIFKGIIVKHTIKFDPGINYAFVLTCSHEAVKMTYNEKERSFEKKSDDGLMNDIISEYGIPCSVNSSSEVNEGMFQKMSTDWDFILNRCNFNGSIIRLDDSSGIIITPPTLSGSPVLSIEAGSSIISFTGSFDAGFQPSGVTASAWDPESVSLISVSAAEPAMNIQGNIKPKDLSLSLSPAVLNVTSVTPMTKGTLQKWADGILLRKRLSAFKGIVKFAGTAFVKTGSLVEIKGVGKKLSGEAFVSEVTQTIESGNWYTEVVFGFNNDCVLENQGCYYLPALNQLPGMQGLQLAMVKQIDQDPQSLSRILVEIASGLMETITTWARMANYYASNKSGSFFIPEIGDEVVLGFLDNDPSYPVILGSLYNGRNNAAFPATAANNIKAFVSRSQLKMEFDEEKKSISLSTPANGSIVISDDGNTIEIHDQNGNSIILNTNGISIESSKNIDINANGNITLNAKGKIMAIAKEDLTLSGLNIQANAEMALTAKGSATAELSASGETTIKGAIVRIN